MIFDAENMFCDKKEISSAEFYSDVVENSGGGDAYNPVFLFLVVTGGNTEGTIETELQTADDEEFTTPTIASTYESSQIQTKLPHGMKKFMRLKVTSTYTTGKITAALVGDVDLK